MSEAREFARLNLVSRVQGKTINLRDLKTILGDWPAEQSNHYAVLKEELTADLPNLVTDRRHHHVVIEADPALLTCMMFPEADKDDLIILVRHVLWLGLWDDAAEYLAKHADTRTFKNFLNDTTKYVAQSLGFDNRMGLDADEISEYVTNFNIAADCLWNYTPYQRYDFNEFVKKHVAVAGAQSEYLHSASLPVWIEYWNFRASVGSIGPLVGMIDFAANTYLDRDIVASAPFQTILQSTNIIVCLVNDLLSLKKELASGSAVSAVPIFHLVDGHPIQRAVDITLGQIRNAIASFIQAEQTLTAKWRPVQIKFGPLSRVMTGLKHICTGNLNWSLQCERYGMAQFVRPDGTIEFTL